MTLAVWLAGAGALRAVVLRPEVCPPVDESSLEASATAAVAWIQRAQLDDGSYVYEWHGETGAYSADYNEVRHAGVTMSLYQRATLGDESVLPVADRGLDWMIANLERRHDWAALKLPDETYWLKLGAASLMLASLDLRREATGDEQYDELMRELGRFILVMQREDGSMLNYYLMGDDAPDPTVTSRYATGEAFWALAMLHEHFPGEGWDVAALKIADYLALERDDAEAFKFPPWADQWAAYGLAEIVEWGLDEHHITYAESLAARFGLLIRSESGRTEHWFNDLTRGREARAAGMGTWVEGINSLWRVAAADPRLAHLEADIAERAQCGAGILAARQTGAGESDNYPDPALAEGAWFSQEVTRMDDQQHALSGLILTKEMLEQ